MRRGVKVNFWRELVGTRGCRVEQLRLPGADERFVNMLNTPVSAGFFDFLTILSNIQLFTVRCC